ncbi:unnamed protein product [Diamesa serratosioi]
MKFLVLIAVLAFVCVASAMPPRGRSESSDASESSSHRQKKNNKKDQESWEMVVEDMLKVADSEREKADRNMRVADYLKDWYDGLTIDMQRNQRLAYMISRTADAVEARELTNGQVPLQVLEGTGYSTSNDVSEKRVLVEDPTQIVEEVEPKINLEALIEKSNLADDAKLFEETLVKSIIRDELKAISETEFAQAMKKPFVDDVFLAMEHIVHAIELVESAREVVESAKGVIAPGAEAILPVIDLTEPAAEAKETIAPAVEQAVPVMEVIIPATVVEVGEEAV